MGSGPSGPSAAQRQAQQDLAKRQQTLDEEEAAEKKSARQRELAIIRRSFGSTGGGLPTTQTSLLG